MSTAGGDRVVSNGGGRRRLSLGLDTADWLLADNYFFCLGRVDEELADDRHAVLVIKRNDAASSGLSRGLLLERFFGPPWHVAVEIIAAYIAYGAIFALRENQVWFDVGL